MSLHPSHIKLRPLLLPLSWLYGLAVYLRNLCFDLNILRSKHYPIPVIGIGNITVGGTGKTPHTEYILRLLAPKYRVAILSRGYKRKSKGFILADEHATTDTLGDEPLQMYKKFPQAQVAVCKSRRKGIELLIEHNPSNLVIILDDAFQHRYVTPGCSILLIDHNRLPYEDYLLPVGQLREPFSEKHRAQIIIITKCPATMKPIDLRIITKYINPFPYQSVYFSRMRYGHALPVFASHEAPITQEQIIEYDHILIVSGIANPTHLIEDIQSWGVKQVENLSFTDHHCYNSRDIAMIEELFAPWAGSKIILTTEKDAMHLRETDGISSALKSALYYLPIEVEIFPDQEESFRKEIFNFAKNNATRKGIIH